MTIKLIAKLRAYSKAPFYPDFVRDVYSQKDSQPEFKYVRSYSKKLNDLGEEIFSGSWVPIDPLLKDLDDKLIQLDSSLTQNQITLNSLKEQVKGSGENLIPYNFGNLEQDEPQAYALDDSSSNANVLDSYAHQTLDVIPDQTKIYNKFDNKTWTYVEKTHQWIDNGGRVFVPATNTGVFGVVTGSRDKFKASVDESDGTLSINGLSEELNDIRSKLASEVCNLDLKLNEGIRKCESSNGYLVANNFNTDTPSQDSLTNTALEYLEVSHVEDIPNGSKIKNTFNNHVWVFNKDLDPTDNITRYKWGDFGSDSVCIANNDGVHGLVTGSQENFKGFIDINGVISINGLEEEFNTITQTLSELISQVKSIQYTYTAKLDEIETKLNELKENA